MSVLVRKFYLCWRVGQFVALCLLFLGCAGDEPRSSLPNIVLVMADDQGWGDVAYNGHPVLKTPHLDEMAASGLRFDRFYAAAPVCSPTRGSVMTGRHPNRFGCFKWGNTLRPQETTIAEVLKTAGYATGHFGKWHLGSVRKGSPVNPGASGFDEWFSAPNFFDNGAIMSAQGVAVQTEGESSMVTVDAALEFINRNVSEGNTFFAVVWFGSPHSPHEAFDQDRIPYADQEEALQHLYGEITAMDRAIGKLRGRIHELGIQNNTLLWYCSDNGALKAGGSSGGHRGKKGDVYDGGLLVPAVLEWPERIPSPRTTSTRANTSDIFPTLLEVAGIARDDERVLDGISLVPVFEGGNEARPKPMGFWDFPEPGIRTPSVEWMAELMAAQTAGYEPEDKWKLRLDAGEIKKQYSGDSLPGHSAWIDGDWKLHRIADKSGEQVSFELYNLAEDPAEQVDLKEKEQERTKSMIRSLETWQKSVIRSLNGEDYR